MTCTLQTSTAAPPVWARPSDVAWRVLRTLFVILAASLALCGQSAIAGSGSVSLTATPDVILADGANEATITAVVHDDRGQFVVDGTQVHFTTNLGLLEQDSASTIAGVARVKLRSAVQVGSAKITATSFVSAADGSAMGSTQVEFTNDRDAAYSLNGSRWISLDCPQGVVYDADTKVAEAHGKAGSAHLRLMSLDINADAIQVNLLTEMLLARNATLRRGKHVLHCVELRYSLSGGTGTAVAESTQLHHPFAGVRVFGYALQTEPLDAATTQATIENNIYRFSDVSDGHVIVLARGINANPGDRIQFRHAQIFSDGHKVLSVPYHIMAMNSDQLFGQQLLGFGTTGFFINVPFYYHVSPTSTGTLFLRNAASSGATSTGLSSAMLASGQNGYSSGLTIDLDHTYVLGRGGAGELSLTGMTQSTWGAHWNHSQRLDEKTNSFLYVDYPAHRSLFASAGINRQFQGYSVSFSATGNRDPGYAGFSSSERTISAYLQANPRKLGHSGLTMVANLSAQRGSITQSSPTTGTVTIPLSTRGATVQFYTAPFHPDRRTNVTDSLALGESWSATGEQSPTALLTLNMSRPTGPTGSLSANYTYRYDPLYSQPAATSSAYNPLGSIYQSPVSQRVTVGYVVVPRPKLSLSLFGSYGLPLHDNNLFATANYRVNSNYGLALSTSFDHYGTANYRETELSLSRRFLGRDLVFTYSTLTKKLRFDLAASGL